MRIDLHTHSSVSDGTETPAELVATAHAAGLDVVALTDHDTTGGWAAAWAARPPGLTVVPGMELSCRWVPADSPPISVHLLAYLFDPQHPAFAAERVRLREERLSRGERIVAALAADGHPVAWERIVERSEGGVVGRPHIARALVEAGVVESVDHAFATLLHPRSPHYVAKRDTDDLVGSFFEAEHLGGDTDMVALIAAIVKEEARRKAEGRADWQIPMRPDHGQDIVDDLNRRGQPGYPTIGRLRGLAELRGVMTALEHAQYGLGA